MTALNSTPPPNSRPRSISNRIEAKPESVYPSCMTLTAIKKLAIKLPVRDRMKLADAMWKSVPTLRGPSSLEELERRADEVDAGTAKLITSEEFDAKIAHLRASMRRRRPAHRD